MKMFRWMFGLVLLGLVGCSEDAKRQDAVQRMIQCGFSSDQACAESMICKSVDNPLTYMDILEVGKSLAGANAHDLKLVGKDTREGWSQYNYSLAGKTLYVTFCEDGLSGPIATLAID